MKISPATTKKERRLTREKTEMRTNERYTRNREAGNKNENKSTMHNNMCFLSFGVFICRLVCLSVHLFDSLFAHMNCGGRKMSEVS